MSGVRVTTASVAHPAHILDQDATARWVADETGDERRVAALARGTRIERRAFALTSHEVAGLGSTAERNALYQQHAPSLAIEAAGAAMSAVPGDGIDCLVTSSCTGYMVPGWAVDLVDEFGMRGDVSRTPITEAGCAGGVVGLARAADYLLARRRGTALVVATELCSLAYQRSREDDVLTANMLFADGAGAALLSYGDERGADEPGLTIRDMASVLVPDSRDLLGFNLTDTGFSPVISRRLARTLAPAAARAAVDLLARNELGPRDVGAWLVHPGGARILEGIEDVLRLDRCVTRWSWDSLAESGNTSSAAIFDVLRRYLDDEAAPRGNALLMAFGPGVSIELILASREC